MNGTDVASLIRILLNGKEGTIGLMPPVGQTLNDEQIAGVLTYIRRMWGHTGSPVSPLEVDRNPRAQQGPQDAVDATMN